MSEAMLGEISDLVASVGDLQIAVNNYAISNR